MIDILQKIEKASNCNNWEITLNSKVIFASAATYTISDLLLLSSTAHTSKNKGSEGKGMRIYPEARRCKKKINGIT